MDNINLLQYEEEELWEILTMYSFFICLLTTEIKNNNNDNLQDLGPGNILIKYKRLFGSNLISNKYKKNYGVKYSDGSEAKRMSDTELKTVEFPTSFFDVESLKNETMKMLIRLFQQLGFFKIETIGGADKIIINNAIKGIFSFKIKYVQIKSLNSNYNGPNVLVPVLDGPITINANYEGIINDRRVLNEWLIVFNSIFNNMSLILNPRGKSLSEKQVTIYEELMRTSRMFGELQTLNDEHNRVVNIRYDENLINNLINTLKKLLNNSNDNEEKNNIIILIKNLTKDKNVEIIIALSRLPNNELLQIINMLKDEMELKNIIDDINNILINSAIQIILDNGEYKIIEADEVNMLLNKKKLEEQNKIKEINKALNIIADENVPIEEKKQRINLLFEKGDIPNINEIANPNAPNINIPDVPNVPNAPNVPNVPNVPNPPAAGGYQFYLNMVGDIVKNALGYAYSVVKSVLPILDTGNNDVSIRISSTLINSILVGAFFYYLEIALQHKILYLIGWLTANYYLYNSKPSLLFLINLSLLLLLFLWGWTSEYNTENRDRITVTYPNIPGIPVSYTIENPTSSVVSPAISPRLTATLGQSPSAYITTRSPLPTPLTTILPDDVKKIIDDNNNSMGIASRYLKYTITLGSALIAGFVFYKSYTGINALSAIILVGTTLHLTYDKITGGDDIDRVIDFSIETISSGVDVVIAAKDIAIAAGQVSRELAKEAIPAVKRVIPDAIKEALPVIRETISSITEIFPPKYIIVFVAFGYGIYYVSTGIKAIKESII